MSNVPVLQSVRAADAFRRLHWRRVAGVLAVLAVATTVSEAGSLAGITGLWAADFLGIVAVVAAYAALMRLAFVDEHPGDPEFVPGPYGFQWGKPEWRLIGVGLLLLFLVVICLALAIFAGFVIAAAAGLSSMFDPEMSPESLMEALGPGGQAAMSLLILTLLAVLIFLSTRLVLAAAATVARKQVVVFQTWPLTKGEFWRILAAVILVNIPAILAGIVAALVASLLVGDGDATALPLPVAVIAAAIPGVVSAFIVLPLSAGLTAYLYRGLRPLDGDQGVEARPASSPPAP